MREQERWQETAPEWGRLKRYDYCMQCVKLNWILDQTGNRDFSGTVDNNRSSFYYWSCNFSLDLKLFQNKLLLKGICIYLHALRRQWVPNWKHNSFILAETVHLHQGSGHQSECTYTFFWWLQVTWDHQANYESEHPHFYLGRTNCYRNCPPSINN